MNKKYPRIQEVSIIVDVLEIIVELLEKFAEDTTIINNTRSKATMLQNIRQEVLLNLTTISVSIAN